MKKIKKMAMLGVAALFLLGLCACGKATVKINDGGTVTEIETSVPSTVEKILGEAEIALEEGDEVTPSLDTEISEEQEIVILRKHTVKLTADGKTREVIMAGGTVGDLLKQEGITLGEKQHINHGLEENLADGMELKISYSYSIRSNATGKPRSMKQKKQLSAARWQSLGLRWVKTTG